MARSGSELLELYSRYHSRPSPEPLTAAEVTLWNAKLDDRKKKVSTAFFKYSGDRGPFSTWATQCEAYLHTQRTTGRGDGDPTFVWQQFMDRTRTDLAEFAMVLLDHCCNHGGNERSFSTVVAHTSTPLRSRLGLHKLEKTDKIGDEMRREHARDALNTV
ncbi:hypothetical protein EXIGLDRAFT_696633 [Exidia glandulosa HHB12029]|uniref:Uncharacterized protein n=1 Tax=Exidia glandulosa HHB12029 TaxID=1314781 RepID=A0A165F7Q5_EXIGL|nr:hypothetical protein EXIGLDRAFT_696633 [Exidia glandulosa HHB12029]